MTLIEWTDSTWNPVAGCSVMSAGCTNTTHCEPFVGMGGVLRRTEKTKVEVANRIYHIVQQPIQIRASYKAGYTKTYIYK